MSVLPILFALLLLALPSHAAIAIGHWLIEPLRHRFALHGLEDLVTYQGLIVLGGSHERLAEAGRVARAQPHLKIFVSGAGEPDEVRRWLGGAIAPERIDIDTLATTTHENALFTARFLMPTDDQRWLLITTDFHMPRAMGSFRRAGFNVTPWPVEHGTGPGLLGAARHEWLGLAAYWLLGRSSALFPGPTP